MPYSYPEIRKFLGLFAQQNSFDMPDGAMERAMNIVINDDNVVTKLRGFYQYFSPGSGTLKALTTYQNKLMSVYADKIAYYTDTGSAPNLTGVESVLTGSAVAITGSRVPQFAESNGNLFFTTDSGVKVIDAYNGKVFDAGAPAALDLNGNFLPSTGPITGDSSVAYRVVFGRRDANSNLILGAPSDILVISNRKVSGSTYTSAGGGPWTVTVTTASAHNLSTGMQVVVSGATDTDANGTYTITVTGTTTFTYSVTAADPASGTLNWAAARASLIEFSVPEGISSGDGWFYQLYRSSLTAQASVSPTADFRLVDEKTLTSGEISSGLVTYEDTVDDFLVSFASELYTNPNSREGESQSNFQPPLCEDLAFFNNYMFYLNCESRHYLSLDVETVNGMVSGDWIEIQTYNTVTSTAVTTKKIVAKTGVANETTKFTASSGGGDLLFTYTAHGFSNGWKIEIGGISGGTLTAGTYYVVSAGANDFKISATSGGPAIAFNSEVFAYIQAVTDGTDAIFKLGNSGTASQDIQSTALGIVKAVNRLAFDVAANYASSINDVPGKMRLTSLVFKHQIRVRASSTTVGSCFFPVVGTSFSATDAVKSTSDVEPNGVYVAKVGEPWAVPLLNKFFAGSKNQGIFRGLALRNSVLILKPDGVFKLTGDTPSNFSIVLIDNTVRIISRKSAQATANQVYFLTSEGVCAATDSSVEVLSRRVENRFENIVGLDNIDEQTAAVAYDTDRTYRICTVAPNETVASAVYLHNSINDTWTESDILFTGGTVGPGNLLFLISGNKILKERKNQNRIDFCGQNVATTIVSVASDKLSAVISMTGTPVVGDIIEKSNQFSRITSVTASGSDWLVTFAAASNLVATNTPWLYRAYESQWIMAPFHAGSIGRTKHFAQMQMHTRTPSVTRIKVDFIGQTFGGDETTEWRTVNVSPTEGWGESPWGFFNWGLEDGIRNIYNTTPAPVIRLYVPLFQARSTFIKAILTHREAGEAIDAQAITWAIRGYNERVTK